MSKDNKLLQAVVIVAGAVLGYSLYKGISKRSGSILDIIDDSLPKKEKKRKKKKNKKVKGVALEEKADKSFKVFFEGTKYIISGDDVLMTAKDFIVNVLGEDPGKIAIAELVGDSGRMILNMEEPMDLYAISRKEGPEYIRVLFEDVPMSKDSVTNVNSKDDAVIEKTSNEGISILSKDKKKLVYSIMVNGDKIGSDEKSMTGIQIKRAAGILEENCLWMKSSEQDALISNTQLINLETYKNAEFYTGRCLNDADVGYTKPLRRGKKAIPRVIMVNDKPFTWLHQKITGSDIKRMVPETIKAPYNYEVKQIFLRKPPKPIGDTQIIELWIKMKFKFEVMETGNGTQKNT